MTYDTYEQSVASGEPIELYDIYDVDGLHYRWTTASETITYLAADYEPAIVDHADMQLGSNGEVNALEVMLSRSNSLTNRLIEAPIEGELPITIYRQHAGFTATFWQGFVIAAIFDTDGVPKLRCEPRSSDMPGIGERRRNQRLCDHCLYRLGCGVNPESYRVNGTFTNVNGKTLTSSEFATKTDGWFIGGEVIVGNARRLIKAHATNTITVTRAFLSDVTIGSTFRAYAGCDHTPTTCKDKFDNKMNYGGNEYLPVKNPFTSNIQY